MPIGNYIYNPINSNKINRVDMEYFMYGLLKDICTNSNNPLLNSQTQVNFEGDWNLKSLDNVKMLISFSLNTNDQRNVNLNQQLKDNGDVIKVVYTVDAIVKKDEVNTADFLIATQEIVDGLTNNWNSTTSISLNYIATVPSGKTLSTPLTQNQTDGFAQINIAQESPDQPNYLTYLNNFLIILNK